jgi:glucuronyl/N-acetylglucosaminyl transferase EXT1
MGWIQPAPGRDVLSRVLPHWNGGRNHVFFELSDKDVPDVDPEQAIVIRSNCRQYMCRDHFDVSIPSYPRSFVDESQMNVMAYPGQRKYLLSFKGTRNRMKLYRNRLFSIHNGDDIVIACACSEDGVLPLVDAEGCERDQQLYAQYAFDELLINSTFSLVPEGYGAHTSRTAEVMQSGSIPILINDDLIPPLPGLVDWSEVSFSFPITAIDRIPAFLRSVPADVVLRMQTRARQLYVQHLRTPRLVFQAGLEVLRRRISAIPPWTHEGL